MNRSHARADAFGLSRISWRTYNVIKKKAMEQEFSWSGLLISLSIAFFIVFISAEGLNLTYKSIMAGKEKTSMPNEKIYRLESSASLNENSLVNRILGIKAAQAAASSDFQGAITKATDNLETTTDKEIAYSVTIKNTGKKTWEKDKVFLETGPFLRSLSKFKHDSWIKYYRVAGLEKNIKPGETAVFKFNLRSPKVGGGLFQENLQLVIDSQPIPGTTLRLFINVKNDAKPEIEIISAITNKNTEIKKSAATVVTSANPVFCIAATAKDDEADYAQCQTDAKENDLSNGKSQYGAVGKEPIIRVGLFKTKNVQKISVNQYYDIYAGKELFISGLSPSTIVMAGYDFTTKKYYLSISGITKYSANHLRIVPRNKGVITLLDYNNNPAWNKSLNDNQFRNIIEFHYSDSTGNLWVINELPIEDYLKGMAETSNYSPLEFQKVLVTAARTYAMYHYNRGVEYGVADGSTKHANEHFHIDATYDQVYKGYSSELRMPVLSKASDETRGSVVTYQDKIVVTPYYSRSDGRTRSWQEVWYGDPKPWLISVAVPEDEGQTLWGHGVGMSARGALLMSQTKKWQDILKYFYTGIEIKQAYN